MAELTARESERQRVQKVGQVYRDKGYDVRKEVALFFQNGH